MRRAVVMASVVMFVAGTASNAQTRPAPATIVPGSELQVTLVTIGSGADVDERFGHNALLFRNTTSGQSVAYHWGWFNFSDPGFYWRFLTGDTRYSMGGSDGLALINSARAQSRPIVLQRLNLSRAQALALHDFVEWNALDANKYYRYDYFRDNCSTRLRDALDRVLGGAIKLATDTVRTALSYRRESVRLTEGDPPLQAGIDIALGQPADARLSEWDSFFIPMRLRDGIRAVMIPGPDGTEVSLVGSEYSIATLPFQKPIVEAKSAPSLGLRYLLAGLALAVIAVILRLAMFSSDEAAWWFAALGALWSLICGVLGVILLLAWFATRHVFWRGNENVLVLSPLSFVLAVLIPIAIVYRRHEPTTRMIATIVAGLGIIELLLAMIPGGQEDKAIVALLLPMHIAIAWAIALPRRAVVVPVAASRAADSSLRPE